MTTFPHNNFTLVFNGCTHKEPHQSKYDEEREDEDEKDDKVAEGCVALKSQSQKWPTSLKVKDKQGPFYNLYSKLDWPAGQGSRLEVTKPGVKLSNLRSSMKFQHCKHSQSSLESTCQIVIQHYQQQEINLQCT